MQRSAGNLHLPLHPIELARSGRGSARSDCSACLLRPAMRAVDMSWPVAQGAERESVRACMSDALRDRFNGTSSSPWFATLLVCDEGDGVDLLARLAFCVWAVRTTGGDLKAVNSECQVQSRLPRIWSNNPKFGHFGGNDSNIGPTSHIVRPKPRETKFPRDEPRLGRSEPRVGRTCSESVLAGGRVKFGRFRIN